MSHRKWRETKQKPGRARSGHQLSCCLVPSLHFLCDILTSHPVASVLFALPAIGFLSSAAPVMAQEHGPGRREGLRHHPLRRLREVVAVDLLEHPPRALHVLHEGEGLDDIG